MINCKKERSKLIFTRTDGRTATFDLADQSCYNFQGRQVKSLNSFFANYSIYNITWEDTNYKKLVDVVDDNNSRIRNIGSMLSLLHYYRHNEGYILLGLPANRLMTKPISDYSKPARKFLIKKFAHDNYQGNEYNKAYKFRSWSKFLEEGDIAKLEILNVIDRLGLNDLIDIDSVYELTRIYDMVNNYNMELKSLLVQISNYVRREGLTLSKILSELADYNRMSKTMTTKYQKYPKYLLSTHAIVTKNFNAFRETYEEQAFLNNVNKSLAHKGVSYSVLVAEKSQDVKDEGATLHHCVASYVSSIISGTTQIVFMRTTNNIDKPLLTIEVKDGSIYQIKGTYNRSATADEMKFITTYAKAKSLTIGKYL